MTCHIPSTILACARRGTEEFADWANGRGRYEQDPAPPFSHVALSDLAACALFLLGEAGQAGPARDAGEAGGA